MILSSPACPVCTSEVPKVVYEVLRSPGKPLPYLARHIMECRFGRDFSAVRIHQGALAHQAARALGAEAFTVGCHIVFAADSPDLYSPEGLRLLAHELTHVLQQTSHDPSPDGPLFVGCDAEAEAEAEAVAGAILWGVPMQVQRKAGGAVALTRQPSPSPVGGRSPRHGGAGR